MRDKSEDNAGAHVFGDHAEHMASLGLAVVPLGRDRKPKVSGFNRWSHPPTVRTVAHWAHKYRDANIGILPGLSGVCVADVDSADQVGEVENLFGQTPLRVTTKRGVHLYYAETQERLPGTLRKSGLDVDLKFGSSIVIAPPSVHESGHIYRLEGVDWSARCELPKPNIERLRGLLEGKISTRVADGVREMRDGSRRQWLNDRLCRQVGYCDTFDELLDVTRTLNMDLSKLGHQPLEDAVVFARAQKVWRDRQDGKIEPMLGGTGIAQLEESEIAALTRLDSKGAGDAFMLLAKLRIAHSARCRRNETFCITPQSMERDEVIPGWPWKRYMRARDLLIQANLVEKVSRFKSTRYGRIPAQYRLPTFGGRRSGYITSNFRT